MQPLLQGTIIQQGSSVDIEPPAAFCKMNSSLPPRRTVLAVHLGLTAFDLVKR